MHDASLAKFTRARSSFRIFAGLIGGAAAALLAVYPVAAEEIRLRIGYFPNITHVQALVARQFEKQNPEWFRGRLGSGVKLEWYSYNAGPSVMEAIFANSLDLTYVGPNPALNAYMRSRGEEIRVVSGAMKGGAALVVQGDSTLTKPADFRGRRIATPQFGNTQDVSARAWLAAGGLRITQTGGDAQVVPTQNPDQLALFKARQLDGVWTVEPWVSRLELEARGKVLVDETDAITTVLVSRRLFLDERRELVRKFADAHRELTAWIVAHPGEAQAMVRDQLKFELRADPGVELVARAWSRLKPTAEAAPEDFRAFVKSARSVGFLRETTDVSRLVEAP